MRLSDGSIILGLEPLDGVGLLDPVTGANPGCAALSASNTLSWTRPIHTTNINTQLPSLPDISQGDLHDAVEVHSVNTDSRVILDAQIDMLGDTKTKVSSLREVPLLEFVLLDLQPTLQNLLGFRPTDSDVHSNLLVSIYPGKCGRKCRRDDVPLANDVPIPVLHSLPISRIKK